MSGISEKVGSWYADKVAKTFLLEAEGKKAFKEMERETSTSAMWHLFWGCLIYGTCFQMDQGVIYDESIVCTIGGQDALREWLKPFLFYHDASFSVAILVIFLGCCLKFHHVFFFNFVLNFGLGIWGLYLYIDLFANYYRDGAFDCSS